jgi:hypothetical protein
MVFWVFIRVSEKGDLKIINTFNFKNPFNQSNKACSLKTKVSIIKKVKFDNVK